MNKLFVVLVPLLLATAPTTPARAPTQPTDTAKSQIYVLNPYAAGASAGVPNVTPMDVSTCLNGTQAIGLYDDGGSLAPYCFTAQPGVPPYSVQFNNAGAFGGAQKVLIDGGNLVLDSMVAAHPPAPGGANHTIVYEWMAATGMPSQGMSIDNAMGIPRPDGLMNQFNLLGTTANWRVTGCLPVGFSVSTLTEVGDTSGANCAVQGGSCTASGPTWANTNLYTRSPVALSTKTAATGTNTLCGITYVANPSVFFWRGINAGEGGFFYWTRVYLVTENNDGLSVYKMFIGIFSGTALFSAAVEPSTLINVAYFGHDSNSGSITTLNWCTNDGTGAATCSDLGVNFPTVGGAWYDFYIWAPPASSSMYSAVVRLDSAQNSGLITTSSNLPVNTSQYTFTALLGSAGQDAGPIAIGNGGALVMWNY